MNPEQLCKNHPVRATKRKVGDPREHGHRLNSEIRERVSRNHITKNLNKSQSQLAICITNNEIQQKTSDELQYSLKSIKG